MKSRKQLEAQQRYKKEQEERQRIKNEELRYVTHQSIMLWVTIAVIQVKPHANLIIHLHRNFQPPAGRPSFKQFPQGENISIHKWLLNSPLFVCVCVCEEKIRGRMSSNLLILRLYDDRLEMERRRREQQEKEEQEARIKKERQIREVELCRTHCQRSTALLTLCTESLARWSVQQWQLKKVGATTIVLVLPR